MPNEAHVLTVHPMRVEIADVLTQLSQNDLNRGDDDGCRMTTWRDLFGEPLPVIRVYPLMRRASPPPQSVPAPEPCHRCACVIPTCINPGDRAAYHALICPRRSRITGPELSVTYQTPHVIRDRKAHGPAERRRTRLHPTPYSLRARKPVARA